MARAKEEGILQGVVAYFTILTGDGLHVTLRRLDLVMPFMLKCEECTSAWILLGRSIFFISLWRATPRFKLI
jgi:hypothetical protein